MPEATRSMWTSYKKRFVPTQILIFAGCAVLVFGLRLPPERVAVWFVMLQVAAVAGAWWGTRLARRLEELSREKKL